MAACTTFTSVPDVSSIDLFGALFGRISHFSGFPHEFYGESFDGTSLLEENIGEFLLAVVSAFMAYAVITVICLKQRIRNYEKEVYRGITKEKSKMDQDPKEKGDL